MDWDFGDVFWTMLMFFFWVLYISMFISIFSDIFRRHDLSGWGKAGWVILICVLPFLGILIYIATRPKPTPEEIAEMQAYGAGGYVAAKSPAEEIAKLADLRAKGALSEEEFAALKAKAMA